MARDSLYTHLNHAIPMEAGAFRDAWRRVLNRLGDYTATITRSLNMRPARVEWFGQTDHHILVRIHMPQEYVVLRIAPEGDLMREIFFGRMMMRQGLPCARILHQDTSRTLVPFAYLLEGFVGGIGAHDLESPHAWYAVARQTGRILRQMHRSSAPGWGYPGPTGRWIIDDWGAVLKLLHHKRAPPVTAAQLFHENERAAIAELLHHLATSCEQPCVLHGNMGPQAVRCTTGEQEHVQTGALVEPGFVVAGDGLLDLAWGLDPLYPHEWRTGLLEGYGSLIPLSADEKERLWGYLLLVSFWKTCERYFLAQPFETNRDYVKAELGTWEQDG